MNYLFEQLRFVRGQTLKQLDGVTEEQADRIPEGFRNSIWWHAGHIYVALERFAFKSIGLPQQLPEGFELRFQNGTSPLDDVCISAPRPTLAELRERLIPQVERIQETLAARLNEPATPYTTSAGMTLSSPVESLTFNLYHEGMHLNQIKVYKKLTAAPSPP